MYCNPPPVVAELLVREAEASPTQMPRILQMTIVQR
jgi:hypothetical protein